MSMLLHNLIEDSCHRSPDSPALHFKDSSLSYAELSQAVEKCSRGFLQAGLSRQERVAIYLPKRFENVIAMFAASHASGVFVPVNPILKADQVTHILRDCNARILLTSRDRLNALHDDLRRCHDLRTIVLVDTEKEISTDLPLQVLSWKQLLEAPVQPAPASIDTDMVSILYTSGSTGKPKGVVLSHRNMVAGAKSVASYLQNSAMDRLLAVLPFSFDYGFSQLSTAFHSGASVVLMDYLLPRDVIRAIGRYGVTGLAAVPPLWIQLAQLPWSEEARNSLRYLTNSGGAMPLAVIEQLQTTLPDTDIVLMYGLTEAFRSTYLPASELAQRPDSMGKAIPNAEIMVVREDGSPCVPGEEGELVHRGSLVAMGYWNDAEKTAERFRPTPGQDPALPITEIAVWSGDKVKVDEDGYFYFIARKDEMIKTSGYRVSPTEVEEIIYQSGLAGEVVALGLPHPALGQAILVVVTPLPDMSSVDMDAILDYCRLKLPAYMIPGKIIEQHSLPRNPNGKINRKQLHQEFTEIFLDSE